MGIVFNRFLKQLTLSGSQDSSIKLELWIRINSIPFYVKFF